MATLTVIEGRRARVARFNPEVESEVAAAKAEFDEKRKAGFVAVAVEEGGSKALAEFDPTNPKTVLIPALRGG